MTKLEELEDDFLTAANAATKAGAGYTTRPWERTVDAWFAYHAELEKQSKESET